MAKQRVPNLEELNEQEAYCFLEGLLSRLDPAEEYEARHPEDYVMEMPQSGERFRGRESVRAFQESYPSEPVSGPCAASAAAQGTGEGGVVGGRGRSRVRRRGDGCGAYPRAQGREDVAGQVVLRRAVRVARVEGAVGRAGGALRLKLI